VSRKGLAMTSAQVVGTRIDLQDVFRGPLHRPGDVACDAQRAGWHPGFDSRPAIVAEATGPDDGRAAAAPLRAYATGGSFLNFLRDPSRVESAYTTADYRRLRGIKRAYDPTNVFRSNHNILPGRDPR